MIKIKRMATILWKDHLTCFYTLDMTVNRIQAKTPKHQRRLALWRVREKEKSLQEPFQSSEQLQIFWQLKIKKHT